MINVAYKMSFTSVGFLQPCKIYTFLPKSLFIKFQLRFIYFSLFAGKRPETDETTLILLPSKLSMREITLRCAKSKENKFSVYSLSRSSRLSDGSNRDQVAVQIPFPILGRANDFVEPLPRSF